LKQKFEGPRIQEDDSDEDDYGDQDSEEGDYVDPDDFDDYDPNDIFGDGLGGGFGGAFGGGLGGGFGGSIFANHRAKKRAKSPPKDSKELIEFIRLAKIYGIYAESGDKIHIPTAFPLNSKPLATYFTNKQGLNKFGKAYALESKNMT